MARSSLSNGRSNRFLKYGRYLPFFFFILHCKKINWQCKVIRNSVMLQQQCVACNLTIPDSYSTDGSCTCGHVFTEKKLIGGKRFSEYRAELYSRLENKKQRHLSRGENKSVNEAIEGEKSFEYPCSLKDVRPNFPITEKIIKRNASQRTTETFARPKPVIRRPLNQPQVIKPKLDVTQTKVLQNLLRRFPSALAEINKRLTSQNLLWFTLNARARHQHDQATDR